MNYDDFLMISVFCPIFRPKRLKIAKMIFFGVWATKLSNLQFYFYFLGVLWVDRGGGYNILPYIRIF